ncbi:flavin monoamine oxidase family protein [Lentzea sp. NPDC059081]|uniref:flavin monoamine oxidase family protein n=1 Tax=Lentzea sp. NPDC059081 TaxID=3346719 RepID=UPI0036B62693
MATQLRTVERLRLAARTPKTVTILGAGVSGLVAAYELERRGHRVEVIEAGGRIGGRVHTHRFGAGPGAPAVELGAMRIKSDHTRTRHYIAQLGLAGDLAEFDTLLSDQNNLLHVEDTGHVRVRDAPEVLSGRLAGRLGRHRYRPATLVFGTWLETCLTAIAPREFGGRPEVGRELLDVVDGIDLTPYLHAGGARIDLHAVFADHPRLRTGAFLGRERMLADVLDETSFALHRLRSGMDGLTNRLADEVRGPIALNHEVLGLSVRPDGVDLTLRHGSTIAHHACEYVLCTIPFTVLRTLRLDGIDADKRAVINETRYWPATKVALHCREPFWQADGITGGASYTGGLARQTYYPPAPDTGDRGAALLVSYTIGPDADELAKLGGPGLLRAVVEEVGRMHPALLEPGMVLGSKVQAWGGHRWSRGAAAIRWEQDLGTQQDHRAAAARPQGPLFFAGEHCSSTPAWIEGAIESAIDAVHGIEHSGALRWSRRPAVWKEALG